MVRQYKKKSGSRSYRGYTDEQRQQAVRCVQARRLSLRAAHRQFCIPLGTLSHKVNKHSSNPGHPLVFSQDEELTIVEHLKTVADWGFPFHLYDLRILAQMYLNRQGRTVSMFVNNIPGTDWATNFVRRHKEQLTRRVCQNIKSARAGVSADEVKIYFQNLEQSLQNADGTTVPPENIMTRQICPTTQRQKVYL